MAIKIKSAKGKPPGKRIAPDSTKATPADSTRAFLKSEYLSPNTRQIEAVHALTLKDNKASGGPKSNAHRAVIRSYNTFVNDAKDQGTMSPSFAKKRIMIDSVRKSAIRKKR